VRRCIAPNLIEWLSCLGLTAPVADQSCLFGVVPRWKTDSTIAEH
jgi:hypothetical protein